jgi:hypothetical protein
MLPDMEILKSLLKSFLVCDPDRGCNNSVLLRIEGKTPPAIKIDTIERLARALKTNPAGLLKF